VNVEHPPAGFVLKLNRAEHHLVELTNTINAFLASGFYETTSEIDRTRRLISRVVNLKAVSNPRRRLRVQLPIRARPSRIPARAWSHWAAASELGQLNGLSDL
jgi:hypothetical protein